MMHGVLTVSDDDIVNFRMEGYRRHVGKPKWVEVLIEFVENDGICWWDRNLLIVTNCENVVKFHLFDVI